MKPILITLTLLFCWSADGQAATILPQPSISIPLMPGAAPVGNVPVTITVNGSGFVASSLVTANGKVLATTYVSPTVLKATLPASWLSAPSTCYIIVKTAGAGFSWPPVPFYVTNHTKGVEMNSTFIAGCTSFNGLAVDFNVDGKQDFLCNGPDGYNYIYLGNGDGTFGLPIPLPGAPSGNTITADFNGDGKPDLLYTYGLGGGATGNCITLLNAGKTGPDHTWGFKPPIIISSEFCANPTLVPGDFNGDGKIDLVGTSPDQPSTVFVYLGNGDGTFGSAISSPSTTMQGTGGPIAVGDWNRDGTLDIAVHGTYGVTTLIGNGDGTFSSPTDYGDPNPQYFQTGPIAAADLNRDGKLDIAYVGAKAQVIEMIGNGDGTFHRGAFVANLSGWDKNVLLYDFNGDGILDAIPGKSEIIFGNPDGTFSGGSFIPIPDQPAFYGNAAALDFTGDGRPGILYYNRGCEGCSQPGVYLLTQVSQPVVTPTSIVFGDVKVGQKSIPEAIVVKNTGSAPLYLGPIQASKPPFITTTTCGGFVMGGESCRLDIVFAPTVKGSAKGNVVVNFGKTDPVTANFTGTGF